HFAPKCDRRLEVEIGADRNLVLRVSPRDCKSMQILAAHRYGVRQGQFDAAAHERVGTADRADISAQTARGIENHVIRGGDAYAAQALDVGRIARATRKPVHGDFSADENELDARIDS